MQTDSGLTAPDWAQQLAKRWGPFRVVWAPQRLVLMGGYWETDGFFSYRLKPRYPNRICWILERWLHGRNYGTPETWTEQTITPDGYLACGPYPAGGIWECCCLFDSTPLRPDTLAEVLHSIHANRVRSVSELRQFHENATLAEEEALDKEFEEKWDESHGVRRGLSFTHEGVLQCGSDDIENYKARLAAARVKLRRENFQNGFRQGELDVAQIRQG
jgi:hypothetical protein